MTTHQFWHEDMDLYDSYHKAYERNLSYTAWINGMFIKIGVGQAIADAFAKKGTTPTKYPNFEDPITSKPLTKPELETIHRNMMLEQQRFLENRYKE
jgi:hypothetical protein